ncbi:hypothetical protein K1W54_42105 [Micromonospora sp. CPCC 205371]|nr:hypothetical protein [Micromonospora sp. CPCC 205371]
MRRILSVLAAIVIGLTAVAMPSRASAAPGETIWTCGDYPPGTWVLIGFATGYCGGNRLYTGKTDVSGHGIGGSIAVCSSSWVPPGWRVQLTGIGLSGCSYPGQGWQNAMVIVRQS